MSQPLTPPPSQPPVDQPAYPGAVPPPAPQQQQQQGTSGLAITGLVLAFLLPGIGFILSLIAIFKTGPGKRAGRGLAITGVIVSVILSTTYSLLLANWVNDNKTLVDPGCTAGRAAIVAMGTNPTIDQVSKLAADLDAASGKAKDAEVKTALKAIADGYNKIISDAKAGKEPTPAALTKIEGDEKKFDELCTIAS
ncbi:hypothetical protein [Actinoplanes solisilvae]|uniref:hypothetical protein n=1 Tax=Actinoplanes solisilvae TaxID=2486853 RepID=UPI000FD8D1EC|nr:hypothetical protein [Actinoplanes solisilvae]